MNKILKEFRKHCQHYENIIGGGNCKNKKNKHFPYCGIPCPYGDRTHPHLVISLMKRETESIFMEKELLQIVKMFDPNCPDAQAYIDGHCSVVELVKNKFGMGSAQRKKFIDILDGHHYNCAMKIMWYDMACSCEGRKEEEEVKINKLSTTINCNTGYLKGAIEKSAKEINKGFEEAMEEQGKKIHEFFKHVKEGSNEQETLKEIKRFSLSLEEQQGLLDGHTISCILYRRNKKSCSCPLRVPCINGRDTTGEAGSREDERIKPTNNITHWSSIE